MTVGEPSTPEVFVKLVPTPEGCYASARIEGAADGRARIFVGVLRSREEAMESITGWALGWLERLRRAPD